MSVRSVREYLVSQLDGLSVPTITKWSVRALAQPYIFSLLEVPTVWVWPMHVLEDRISAPRGAGGVRERLHTFTVAAAWMFDPTTSDASQFDDLVEVLDTTFYSMKIGQTLTDSVTGETSTLMGVAEGQNEYGNVVWRLAPPKDIQMEGIFYFVGLATLPAWEYLYE